MPIGKNAIKRVENNGYSKVASSAPDMENSNVIANIDPQVVEKIIAPVEKKTQAKKTAAKTPVKTSKKPVAKKVAPAGEKPVETAKEEPKAPVQKRKYVRKAPVVKAEKKENVARVQVGEAMPYYLL